MQKIILVNILLLLVLHVFYVALYFGFGYLLPAMGNEAGSISYVLIILLHLYLNCRLLKKWNNYSPKNLIIFSLVILAVYIGKLFWV